MANIGLDGFLGKDEKRLVNLDWLNVNLADYENLPFDEVPSYIAEPKLIQEWSHEDADSNFKLVPNSNMNFNYDLPKNHMASDIEHDVQELLKLTAKEMMLGKTGTELVKSIREKTSPMIIKAAEEHLRVLAKEQGLLGGVYVDPTIFPSCHEGSQFVSKRAKTAKYVKAMSACGSCIHNSCGRCDVYKKRIATEINYDQELFNFYSKHISSLLGKTIEIQSKDDLQRAFTAKKEEKPRIAEFKPSIAKSKDEKELDTLEKRKDEFETQLQSLKTELNNVLGNKVSKEVASLLVRNYDAKVIKDHVTKKYSSAEYNANKEVFAKILSEQGSLGKVYVDSQLFPVNTASNRDVEDYLNKVASLVKVVVVKEGSENEAIVKRVCAKLGKEVVSSVEEIAHSHYAAEFNKYPEDITSKLASIFEKNATQGLRLAFLQKQISNRTSSAPVITENYGLQAKLDPTRYEPKITQSVSMTPEKIASALDSGYYLSSIIKTGRKLGVEDDVIKANVKKAFERISSVHKRQLDIPVNLPSNVEVKVSQKDISFELDKPVYASNAHEINFNSSEAPVDTLVKDLELKDSNLDLSDIDKKSADIEISGMNEFTID